MFKSDLTPMPLDKFWVVTGISNVVRFKSRYNLYRKFEAHIKSFGVNLMTVEVAFGDRPFEITEEKNPNHLQLRTRHELWHKENFLAAAINRLPADWKWVALVDADLTFQRMDWAQETVQQLQHYDVVQMFSTALDMGPYPDLAIVGQNYGFNYCYQNTIQNKTIPPLLNSDGRLNPKRFTNKSQYGITDKKVYWHPGYAWAWRRSAYERVGLYEYGLLGAGDHAMALGLISRAEESLPSGVTDGYKRAVIAWQKLADKHIRQNIGYVPGVICHEWHGKKGDRQYWNRWKILEKNQFDPYVDVKRDSQGLWQLIDHGDDRSIRLRDEIRAYFRQRCEDSDQLDPV
ncbi:MAG: hypothetical protein RLZZ74_3420 [Cyanobacteriota bacterium]|jgi:hypothetical protein